MNRYYFINLSFAFGALCSFYVGIDAFTILSFVLLFSTLICVMVMISIHTLVCDHDCQMKDEIIV